jgi:hypothetical protein
MAQKPSTKKRVLPAHKNSSAQKKTTAVKKHVAIASHPFITLDGKQLHSLVQLATELDSMTDAVFYHHVTESRHDFSTWIKDCLILDSLAQEVSQAKTKDKTGLVLYRYLFHITE